jgi:transposase
MSRQNAADFCSVMNTSDRYLKLGDMGLVGNSAYRRYLAATASRTMFEIDPSKLADEARLIGIFVLRTNASITALQAVLHYRDLPQVEYLFRITKALIRTRPIDHSSDAAIRSHVFCSFLALVLRKELDERCAKAAFRPEWGNL